ncbi:MAG TPA: amidohydrolase [Gemmatimonadaceae bacterium]|nr:amidohydrolase [Gemmatimonadaceae bacterium]
MSIGRRVGLYGFVFSLVAVPGAVAQKDTAALHAQIEKGVAAIMPQVVAWRRDIHQHPELGNRETRTAQLVADELRSLGIEVRTGVAYTGVVGVLKGGKPGPVVALRADMDALPVTELVDVPFKSTVRTQYNGQEVGVMHACGHDNHVAILLGTAAVLAGMRKDLPGTVKFIFQPAEEGPPAGEQGGAALMVAQGAFADPVPDAVFGLHVWPGRVGEIVYRPGPAMAGSMGLSIVVHGRGTHGAAPWAGVDPVVISSQIVLALQTIPSRQLNVSLTPAILTVATIHGGNRGNIIPDSVVMTGTVRTFDKAMARDIKERIIRTAQHIAESGGATADVQIVDGYDPTVNDSALVARMAPTLQRVAGDRGARVGTLVMASEDFSVYAEHAPGLFFFLGIVPDGKDPATAPANHSPLFFADEGALPVGVRAMSNLAVDYLSGAPTAKRTRLTSR